ncbi:hypothetical protein RRG08_014006 [Elysia crispata]|uniref:G-protein coupled receptors family 1 profile domain-containing protein n=1 Tax=Elysia crispata TaxID=231223 RepID=A0AAE1B1M5_9GAST|nr:hypothetical protein RRG08_014006 [Elysia crispata]
MAEGMSEEQQTGKVFDSNYIVHHSTEFFSEYHITLHPRAKLDGIGESEGGGWVGQGRWKANFSVDCVALNLDYVPPAQLREELLSYCTPLVNLRGLFEPTAMLFGIPGNIVCISACLKMVPLRPASVLLALVAVGDLCTIIAGLLPMEGNYYLTKDRSLHYFWFHSIFAVVSAFPHYTLAALSVERASIAWRPALSCRLVGVLGATAIGITVGTFSVLAVPFVAEAAASSFIGTHEFQMEILVVMSIAPGLVIVAFSLLTAVGLCINADDDENESLASQMSIVMAAHPANPASTQLYDKQEIAAAGNVQEDASVDELLKENPARRITNESALSTMKRTQSILSVLPDEEPKLVPTKASASSTGVDGNSVPLAAGSRHTVNPAVPCALLPEHSSLTRMSLLASLTFFLMVWPLTAVTLAYHGARGPDKSQPVDNPLLMLRLLFLYELFAWVSTLQNSIKFYVYVLGVPRFRKHFVFMMNRHTKGLGVSHGTRQSRSISTNLSLSRLSHTVWTNRAPQRDVSTSPMTDATPMTISCVTGYSTESS